MERLVLGDVVRVVTEVVATKKNAMTTSMTTHYYIEVGEPC